MRAGRRWIALDADFFANHFTDRILERFGPAGVCLFVAFLCACKKSRVPGQVTYASDVEALDLLGVQQLPLVDSSGDNWTLDTFWKFTGTQKQTSRSTHGRLKIVKASHWERWQKSFQRQEEAARKAKSRHEKRQDEFWTAGGQAGGHNGDATPDRDFDLEVDTDLETPLPPEGADASQRRNGNSLSPQVVEELKAKTPKLRGTNA